MAVLVVVAHVVVLILDDPARLALPDLRTAPGRARAGVIAVLGLTALVGTSVWRRWLALSYERWRGIHRVLITLVIAAAFAHVPWVDAYVSLPVVRSSVLGLVLAVAVALFRARVGRPRCDLTAWCRSGASAAMRSPCSSPPTAMTDCASNPGASPGCARRSARMASTTTRSR